MEGQFWVHENPGPHKEDSQNGISQFDILSQYRQDDMKIQEIDYQIHSITNYLQNHAIIRIPQFNEKNCNRSINTNNTIDPDLDCGEMILSEPQLDPSSTQNHLINNYLNQSNNIRIYDVNLM